jgi:(p)ppGpp synthase/HD superfamily hydrolase
MHRVAESGVAAHGSKGSALPPLGLDDKLDWMRQILDCKASGGPARVSGHPRRHLFRTRSFVFTPREKGWICPSARRPLIRLSIIPHRQQMHRRQVNQRIVTLDTALKRATSWRSSPPKLKGALCMAQIFKPARHRQDPQCYKNQMNTEKSSGQGGDGVESAAGQRACPIMAARDGRHQHKYCFRSDDDLYSSVASGAFRRKRCDRLLNATHSHQGADQ